MGDREPRVLREIVQGIEPYRQPVPSRNPDGDCFACATTAALRYLFPDDPPTFDEVWHYWTDDDGDPKNWWGGAQQVFTSLARHGYRVEHFPHLVEPRRDPDKHAYAFYQTYPAAREWARHLEAWLSAGWVCFTEILSTGDGQRDENGYLNTADHFVLLDGVRDQWTPVEDDDKASYRQSLIRVVDSSTRAEPTWWVDANDLMQDHGCAGWILIRRREAP